MTYVKFIIFTVLILSFEIGISNEQQLLRRNILRRLPNTYGRGLKIKQRLKEKVMEARQRNTETICYDLVGCFELPHKRSPLQKVPEDPDMLQTKFYLFRRNIDFSQPELIQYDDNGASAAASKFNHSQPLKVIIHGYMGKWNSKGCLVAAKSYLAMYDCNVILTDWAIGARGPKYVMAAANTEVVGRQLGMLLMLLVSRGLDPSNIHIIGFSLGAHVAGSSSETLKKSGHLIGRITGLDAASPLFRTDHLREKHKKLDKDDALFVDVIHTDASPSAIDGFGLWEPIGHVDFFPNGGQEQPGCTDARQSIVATHFGGYGPCKCRTSLKRYCNAWERDRGIATLDSIASLRIVSVVRTMRWKLRICASPTYPRAADFYVRYSINLETHTRMYYSPFYETHDIRVLPAFLQQSNDKGLNEDIACSHIRAWRIFLETLVNKASNISNYCNFTSFLCPGGLDSFEKGHCFPQIPGPNSPLSLDSKYDSGVGYLGEDAKGEGVMFLVTKGEPPYCGTQLQASVHISRKTGPIKGVIHLDLHYLNDTVNFQIYCEITDFIKTGTIMSGLEAVDYGSLSGDVTSIRSKLTFVEDEQNAPVNVSKALSTVYIDKVIIKDLYGTSWRSVEKGKIRLEASDSSSYPSVEIILQLAQSFH